ncbi:hypothetical protein [Actinomadura litoris]|uniref:hypothetical protein n=1 Tax=Actinomadura litoris TaxID=2678616 RepID=UPI001FA71651|nr:hypothetical protein [Actinomadura litoris]
MSHPDPQIADAVERTARDIARATQPPPVDLPEDAAVYLAWLRSRPEPTDPMGLTRPSGPRRRAKWLNPDQFRTRGKRGRLAPAETSEMYDAAVARLRRLPDCGAASMEAARLRLGDGSPYAQRVLYAAAHPVIPDGNGRARNEAERHGTDAPTCECGTLRDPDGTCWTCGTANTEANA